MKRMHWIAIVGLLAVGFMAGVARAGWAPDGVPLTSPCGDSWQIRPVIASTGSGKAIVAWPQQGIPYDTLAGFDIHAQAIDELGNILWAGEGVPICAAAGHQNYPAIVPDGSGGAIIAWEDARGGPYMQKVDASGNILWLTSGLPATNSGYPGKQTRLVSDGAGGAIIAWLESRALEWDIYAQRVSSSGTLLWGESGIAICTATGEQSELSMASDGSGGAILAWADKRSGSYFDLYAQRVNASGAAQWGTNGTAVCTSAGDQYGSQIAVDASGWATIVWTDDQHDGAPDVYAQRLNASGAAQWEANGIPICTAAGNQRNIAILPDGASGSIIAWVSIEEEAFPQRWDIRVLRVSSAGEIVWTTAAVTGRTTAGSGDSFAVCGDGAGGLILVWQEYREDTYLDICAQEIDYFGGLPWGAEGIEISATPQTNRHPCVAGDGAGGAIVAWGDTRCSPQSIYALGVTSSGYAIATMLRNYRALLEKGFVHLEWTLSEIDNEAVFSVMRSSAPEWRFEEIAEVEAAVSCLSFDFTDATCRGGESYRYRVDYRAASGTARTLFETDEIAVPVMAATLHQNYPNPFNPSTDIAFVLHETEIATLSVHDAAGRQVAVLADGIMEKGLHVARWDGRSDAGTMCSSGIYFYRLRVGKEIMSRKMLLLR